MYYHIRGPHSKVWDFCTPMCINTSSVTSSSELQMVSTAVIVFTKQTFAFSIGIKMRQIASYVSLYPLIRRTPILHTIAKFECCDPVSYALANLSRTWNYNME
ncbi:hypothetical protein TNCV_986751 [Trichonephila clavipes]|uniref:Uncharacterized protein n=1 Tax=Trichonephila clavipes TaxID=2585209 RepID=A0A8X6SM20_TRICX|nr:hypothetical protein TNCV_986751 [Trichonephila clavipes]